MATIQIGTFEDESRIWKNSNSNVSNIQFEDIELIVIDGLDCVYIKDDSTHCGVTSIMEVI